MKRYSNAILWLALVALAFAACPLSAGRLTQSKPRPLRFRWK